MPRAASHSQVIVVLDDGCQRPAQSLCQDGPLLGVPVFLGRVGSHRRGRHASARVRKRSAADGRAREGRGCGPGVAPAPFGPTQRNSGRAEHLRDLETCATSRPLRPRVACRKEFRPKAAAINCSYGLGCQDGSPWPHRGRERIVRSRRLLEQSRSRGLLPKECLRKAAVRAGSHHARHPYNGNRGRNGLSCRKPRDHCGWKACHGARYARRSRQPCSLWPHSGARFRRCCGCPRPFGRLHAIHRGCGTLHAHEHGFRRGGRALCVR